MQSTPQGSGQQLQPTPAPTIPQSQTVAPERTDVNRPVDGSVQPQPPANGAQGQPTGQPESTGSGTEQNNSTMVAPPLLLFNPKDKTAQMPARIAVPVTVAVYEKPVASNPAATKVSSKPVTWQQAQQDAVGWTSASH